MSINQPIVPGAQAPAAKTAAPTTPTAPDSAAQMAALQKERDEYKAKVDIADKKLRVNAIEMKKFSEDKKGIGAKLSEHGKMAKAFEAAGLSPDDLMHFKTVPWPALKKALGDGFYDKLVEHRISGGTMTADEVMAVVERGKSDVRSEFTREQEEAKAATEKRAKEQMESARAELTQDATAFLETSWADYPIFEEHPREAVAQAIVRYQEQEWKKTGKVITAKEASDGLEAIEIARAERMAGIPKYASKLTEKLKPVTVAPVGGSRGTPGSTQSERRTLSNDLTATTPQAKRTARSDEERMRAILALDLSRR